MVKRGYKHNTSVSGTDSEFHDASLFMMLRNPNGMRRPDLISIPGISDPQLSIELKSGKGMKGVLCESQLHYCVTLGEDFSYLFGDQVTQRMEELLPRVEDGSTHVHFPKNNIAFYYAYIHRDDSLKAGDLNIPFAAIKLKWQDQFIVPHEYEFYAFAVARHMRTKEPLELVISQLAETIRQDAMDGCSHYEERRSDRQSWQNIHGGDVLAIFHNDAALAKKPWGVKRVAALREVYAQVDELKRICIEGPNGTKIYVLAKPEHENLWDYQVRSVVKVRRSVIETVNEERERSVTLLDKMVYTPGESLDMFDDSVEEETRRKSGYSFNGTYEEYSMLRRLVTWMGQGEQPFHMVYVKEEVPF